MASLYSLHRQREPGLLTDAIYWKATRDAEYLVKKLKKTKVLGGHNGCVNTVAWNSSGTCLISGSDDCHLNIYDAATGILRTSIHSSHRTNIFCARFLPSLDDCKAVSCAGIGSVEYTELTPMGDYIGHPFKCQTSITYQVATTPCDSNEFLTCEERGIVRLFDLRVKSSCLCNGCQKDILYSFPVAVTCMAVHPVSPYYIACGLGDGSVGLMDRRMVGVGRNTLGSLSASELTQTSTCKRYRASTLGQRSNKITSVQFNSVGSELLVNYSEDYLYLFNSGLFGAGTGPIPKPVYISQCEWYPGVHRRRRREDDVKPKPIGSSVASQPEGVPQYTNTIEKPPPAKKIRLRGDWSDTGPEARPETQSAPEGGSLMSRMSRMFAQWIDMSIDPSDNQDHGVRRGRRRRRIAEGGQRDRGDGRQQSHSGREPQSPAASPSSSDEGSFQLFPNSDNVKADENAATLSSRLHSAQDSATSVSAVGSEERSGGQPSSSGTLTENDRTTGHECDPQQRLLECAEVESSSVTAQSQKLRTLLSTEASLSQEPHGTESEDRVSSREETPGELNSVAAARMQLLGLPPPRTEVGLPQTVEDSGLQRSMNSLVTTLCEKESRDDNVVAVECRAANSRMPGVCIVEGETDSDDVKSCDEQLGPHDLPHQSHDLPHQSQDLPHESHDLPHESHDLPHQSHDLPHQSHDLPHQSHDLPQESHDLPQESHDPSQDSHDPSQDSHDPMSSAMEEEKEVEDSEYSDCLQPFMVYKGHRNSRTMIKQANFLGDNWVMSGSDCGRVFVWNKWSGEVVNLLVADSHVVNCVQPHPEAYVIATSGIDYNIKLWEPLAEEPCTLDDLEEVVQRNEVMLQESRNTITVPSTFILRILAYLNRRRRLQREQQSEDNDSN